MKSILEDYNKFLAYFAFVVLACLVFWKLNFKIVSLVIAFIYIIYLIYKISDFLREEKDEEEKIDKLYKNVDEKVKDNIFNLIFPLTILNSTGEIIWYNHKFSKLINSEDLLETNLVSVIKGVALDKIIRTGKENSQNIKIKSNIYEVYSEGLKLDESDKKYFLVFFNDTATTEIYTRGLSSAASDVYKRQIESRSVLLPLVIPESCADKSSSLLAEWFRLPAASVSVV